MRTQNELTAERSAAMIKPVPDPSTLVAIVRRDPDAFLADDDAAQEWASYTTGALGKEVGQALRAVAATTAGARMLDGICDRRPNVRDLLAT